MAWTLAARADEIASGEPKIVQIAGKEVGLFFERGRHFAVLNYCPHAGAPICQGHVMGTVTATAPGEQSCDHQRVVLRCPWHHWEFDLHSGEAICPIKMKIKTYPVKVEDNQLLVDI